jgi:serine protease Do
MLAFALAFSLAFALGMGSSAFVGASLAPTSASAQTSDGQPSTLADAAAIADKAVVTVTTFVKADPSSGSQFPGQREVPNNQLPNLDIPDGLQPLGSGSGFIIDTTGHVVTNNHVVESGTDFEVTYADGSTDMATLVGNDPFQDVAVLQITLDAGEAVPATIAWANSDDVRAGEPVIAIGNPYGEYANTVTTGTVNAVDRDLDTGYGYDLPNLLQHDADIYPGNSGGPLIDAAGNVVGINVAKAIVGSMGNVNSDGFNFAIESNAAETVVNEILKDGHFERSYLGIMGQATGYGVEVAEIQADGPAEAAGLQVGDIITGVQGIDGNDPNEALDTIIFDRQPGDSVTLEVIRNNADTTVTVTLGERPVATPQ